MPAKLKLLSWSRFILSSARMYCQRYKLRRQALVYYVLVPSPRITLTATSAPKLVSHGHAASKGF